MESETPPFVQLIPGGHGFAKNDYDDEIDTFGYEAGYCNGPRCVFCDSGFCHHCSNEHEYEMCPRAPIVVQEKPKKKEIDAHEPNHQAVTPTS